MSGWKGDWTAFSLCDSTNISLQDSIGAQTYALGPLESTYPILWRCMSYNKSPHACCCFSFRQVTHAL